ncbi:ribonuclease T2 isoform X1 [Entelurus aequoreus]|uniref:ribonuclease T2 isoform X1 n=1 Tax=Entelurus aequoreus TaxID=161455 RepID=UPI002B1D0499|nr:ribonuclease T2 isoform X1 [Entelurus aequoreus]
MRGSRRAVALPSTSDLTGTCLTSGGSKQSQKSHQCKSSNSNTQMTAQLWPTHRRRCKLPSQPLQVLMADWASLSTWQKPRPDKGNLCNSSWHFNSSEIEDLLPDMEKSWPDLLKPTSFAFWKYEWSKHGTCAAKAPSLDSQHKYFSKALELYHKLDLTSILQKFDIIPSENYYKFSQIEGVIENFYGVKPKIQCVHPSKNSDAQTLGQIEICFNSDFSLVDCEKLPLEDQSFSKASIFSVCEQDIPVYYPPLRNIL